MIVLGEIPLRALMTQIVEASHLLTDTAGQHQAMSTIPESQLRMAAICALQIATGLPIWPGDKPIRIVRAKPSGTIIEEQPI